MKYKREETSGGNGTEIEFPLYFTSVEGKGKERHVEPNADSLKLVQWLDENVWHDGKFWYVPDEYYHDILLYIDGIPWTIGEGYSGNDGKWSSMAIYDHQSNTVSGMWAGSINRDGKIFIYDDY